MAASEYMCNGCGATLVGEHAAECEAAQAVAARTGLPLDAVWGAEPPARSVTPAPSSVIGEAALAAASRVDAPKPAPKLSVPPLEYLLAEWQRHSGHTLPVDSTERKSIPVHGGCYAYFPAALAAVAAWSYFNNQKHNPGQALHWSQHKSGDHAECLARHEIDAGDAQVAGDALAELVETTAEAWRALGKLQMLAQCLGAPLAPGSKPKERA